MINTIIFDPAFNVDGVIDGEHIISFSGEMTEEQIELGYDSCVSELDLSGMIVHNHYRIVDYRVLTTLVKKSAGEIASLTTEGDKQNQIAILNAQREAERSSGIEYNGNTFDSDAISLQNINGAVTRVLIAKVEGETEWNEYWITSDNSVVQLDMDDIIGLGKAASKHISDLYTKYKMLKDAV